MPDPRTVLAQPLTLRSGLTLPNRIVKAAMTEGLADRRGNPTRRHERLYRRWADGGLGAMITGNVIVDRRYLERSRNVVADDLTDADAMARYAAACAATPTVVQLSHAGRQTNIAVNARPVSASDLPAVKLLGAFRPARALSTAEVHDVRDRFVAAARDVVRAGFPGVELHAAHGYLLSQFLSPDLNQRTDAYGGSPAARARLLLEIVEAIRATTPSASVWVKVNANDFRRGGATEQDAARVVGWLDEAGVDVVEISGGSYEDAAFISDVDEASRFFLAFARSVVGEVEVPLMVTGGFRDVEAMSAAVEDGVDLIGLARPLAADPELARKLLAGTATEAPAPAPALPGVLTEGADVGWYRLQMELYGLGLDGGWHGVPGTLAFGDYVVRELATAVVDGPRRRALVRQVQRRRQVAAR